MLLPFHSMTQKLIQTKRISTLLRQTTSLQVVRDFLRQKSLPFSGGWDELTNKRLIPYVEDGKVSADDLLALLGSAEECGKQHVFLYTGVPSRVATMIDEKRVLPILAERGLDVLLQQPLNLDMPAAPTIVDIRWEGTGSSRAFVIKEVYTHETRKKGKVDKVGNQIVQFYDVEPTRAVNIAKVYRDGLLEIRLASVSESSYKEQRERFLRHLGELVPIQEFSPLNFGTAKARLHSDRDNLTDKIRFSDAILRNENGVTIKVTTGSSEDDLAQDQGARAGQDAFLRHDNAYADGHNFWFRPVEGLSKQILILLNGEPNEFGIMANCSETDYNYVLRELRALNS